VLRVALAYERATKWHSMNPTLDDNLRRMKTASLEGRDGRMAERRKGTDEDFDW
jgi:hypothetical protein